MQQDYLSADHSSVCLGIPEGPSLCLQEVTILVSRQGKDPETCDPIPDMDFASIK